MGASAVPSRRRATAALSEARAYRALWLVSLTSGECTIGDIILAAASPGGEPLTRISLRTLIRSDPSLNWPRLEPRVQIVLRSMGWDSRQKRRWPTVGWLIDSRSTGARAAAFLDVIGAAHLTMDVPLHMSQ